MLIPFVTISNAGNAADPATGGNYGAVSYEYAISKYDITIQQYVDFLNDVASQPTTDAVVALYDTDMGKPTRVIEQTIIRTGSGTAADPYKYSVSPDASPNDPVVFVNWNQAARFVNYLHNGAVSGASTETGAYDFPTGQVTPTRSADAKFWIPTENEWYKAAYYDPAKAAYDNWATQSTTLPAKDNPPGGTNSVNYQGVRPEGDKLTPVGAYTYTDSAYGTADQAGLVWQWTDTSIGNIEVGINKVVRGGSWSYGISAIDSGTRRDYPTGDTQDQGAYRDDDTGFRIATTASPAATIGNMVPFQLFELVPQEQIGALYAGILGRQADNSGFKYWLSELMSPPLTPQAELATLRKIADDFSLSLEARAKYQAYADPSQATDAEIGLMIREQYEDLFTLDQSMPLTPTESEVVGWTFAFKALASAGKPTGSILIDMIASTMAPDKALQHMGLEYNAAIQVPIAHPLGEIAPAATTDSSFVTTMYWDVLDRTPDADGLAFWVAELQKGHVTRDDFEFAFLNGAYANPSASIDIAHLNSKPAMGDAAAPKTSELVAVLGVAPSSVEGLWW
jgi:formylglycine-generating enzyme required for sulfatase activity